MHTKTMEGLIGARNNMNMTNVPMRVYKEAERKGDLATMERAMGYVNEFEDKAYQYKDKADEGMKEEAEESKEKEKIAREQAIEKRREERKELEEQRIEKSKNEVEHVETASDPAIGETPLNEMNSIIPKNDTVDISDEGRMLLNQSISDTAANLPDAPVLYSSSGTSDKSIRMEAPSLNVTV